MVYVRPEDTHCPCHWWDIGLENVGLDAVRPDVGTYGRYEFDRLHPLHFPAFTSIRKGLGFVCHC